MVIQFRTPDKHTTDYTFKKFPDREVVVKMKWSGPMHHLEPEEEMKIADAVNEILARVESVKK